jgi:glutathione S-transferase
MTDRAGDRPEVVLYRCPTPTNLLCPCGSVARRLRSLGVDHRTERVPYRRRDRPEVEARTGQRRVPLLIDGDEIIHDSKRIREYLDWRYGEAGERAGGKPG